MGHAHGVLDGGLTDMAAQGRRVLVTGHLGYIGAVLVPILMERGYAVTGLDADLYRGCDLAGPPQPAVPNLADDVREIQAGHLAGLDAIIHLAALSNDPLGDLNPDVTYDINHVASVRLARLAREVGVSRFLFSSSCSNYGAAGDAPMREDSTLGPLTAYAISKVRVEHDVARLADETFSPTFLRNATAYGVSPRLRLDLVLNDLVGGAAVAGCIRVLSDGTPWRPLVHVEDIARAFVAMLEAPRETIHNQAFNVGAQGENYRVSDLAGMVHDAVPGSRVEYAEGAGPDPRSYRVDFGKLRRAVPTFAPRWTAREGVRQLCEAFRDGGLVPADLEGPRFKRVRRLKQLLANGTLDERLRRRAGPALPIEPR